MLTILAPSLGAFAADPTILIDPDDDSCRPADPAVASCAAACEANPMGCATDLQSHITGPDFTARRQLYPTTLPNDQNPTTPMHGLFNTIYVNEPAREAIEEGIANPFDPIDLPPWSIVAKFNERPTDEQGTLEVWQTPMYKIPGYCPQRAVNADDGACVGGEWFWYLFRFGQLQVFDSDPKYGGLPAYGKAEAFCLECHGAVSESDWLWMTHFRRERARQVAQPLRKDGEYPGEHGVGLCRDVGALSSNLPPDVRHDPASLPPDDAQRMVDCYAWKAFVAMNWPASDARRGVPTRLPFATPDRNRVWETYAQVYETFQPQDPDWTLDGKDWHAQQQLPQVCQQALEAAAPGTKPEGELAYQVLNESNQAFGNQFNTLTDTNGTELRYNIRLNETEWRYLKENGFADTGSYDYHGPTGATVDFPDNTSDYGPNGAIEIKSAWKELCTDPKTCEIVDDDDRYYTRHAFIYDQALSKSKGVQPESCRIAYVGLVGLHTVLKTFWQPHWIWATFEHVDNVPPTDEPVNPDDPPYTLFDPQCQISEAELEQCVFQRPGVLVSTGPMTCCRNLQIIANASADPDNSLPTDGSPATGEQTAIPNQITRIDPIDDTAQDLNAIFQALLDDAGSPFQYYQLVNAQWAGLGRLGADAEPPFAISQQLCLEGDAGPCFTLLPEGLRLRNTTMESFQVSYCHPDDEDIENNPPDCIPSTVAHDPSLASSAGCMNCHLPSGADASFLWEDAIWERVPLEASASEDFPPSRVR